MRPKWHIKTIAVIIAVIAGYAIPTMAWDAASYQDGTTAGKNIQSKFGNSSQLNNKLIAPLTSDGSQMSTLDGNQSFTAQLPAAQSTDNFLELFASPSGTGDINNLTFKEDTNLDGMQDYAYTVPVSISGVCSNGFISAIPGTWTGLHYYTWTSNASGQVTITGVPSITALAGCYCINSSCGSNLVWNNLNEVLQDLGKGIVNAIQQQKNITVTNIDTASPMEVKYYGQNSGDVGAATSSGFVPSGVSNPQQYFHGGTGTLPGNAELTNESGDPNSFFSEINTLNNAAGNHTTSQSCNIKRQVSFLSNTEIIGYDVKFYIGYDSDGHSQECFWAKEAGDCMDVWQNGGGWDYCKTLNNTNLDTIIHSIVNSGACIPYTDPHSGGTGCFSPPATINAKSYVFIEQTDSGKSPGCYGSGDNNTHQFLHVQAYLVDNPQDYNIQIQGKLILGVKNTPQSSTTGSCAGLDNNTQCVLTQETICDYNNANCVYIVNNFNPTGLTPLSSCHQATAPDTGQAWTFCVDGNNLTAQQGTNAADVLESETDVWWNINRLYACQDNTVYDFSNAQQRLATINNSFTSTGTTATYNDTISPTSNSIDLPPPESTSNCEISCEIKVPAQNTQAGTAGNASQYLTTVNGTQTVIRQCQDNVCPVDTAAGESIVQDCGCINYFSRATAAMQVLDSASKDIICSGSPP